MGDSTANYIDRDLVEVLTMSNSRGTCNCFFTTRESREVLEKVPEWGLTSSSRLNLGVITYRSFIIPGDTPTLIYNMNGVEGTVSGPMEDLMEYDRDAAGLVEYIAALNQGDRDILEEVDLTFKIEDIWETRRKSIGIFAPVWGGMSSMTLRERDSRKGLLSSPRCCSRGTWGGVKNSTIYTIYRYINAPIMAHRTFKTDNRRDCFFTPTELKVYQDNTMRIVYDTVPVSGDFSEKYGNYGISQWFHQTFPVKVDVYLIHKYENFQSTKGYLVHIGDEPAYFSGLGYTYEEAVAECNKIVEKLELRLIDRPLMVSLMKIDQWDFENHEWEFTRSGSKLRGHLNGEDQGVKTKKEWSKYLLENYDPIHG